LLHNGDNTPLRLSLRIIDGTTLGLCLTVGIVHNIAMQLLLGGVDGKKVCISISKINSRVVWLPFGLKDGIGVE